MRLIVLVLVCRVFSVGLVPAQTVDVWLTTVDQSSKLQPQSPLVFTVGVGGDKPLIVDETQFYQEIEGFGASFTDSAAYLLNQVATPLARTNAMNNLFTRNGNGIGVGFVRNPMGASDLARFHYSYDVNPPGGSDPGLLHFSIAHDQADIIPMLKQALKLNPNLKVMASPWSPPGWMKDSGSMIGGSLLPEMYDAFADYFVRYIQAYKIEEIPIHYITLQNEPLYIPNNYPGMGMDAQTQLTILRDHVLPALKESALNTKVLVYDHNWDGSYYPNTVLADPALQAADQVAGTAWHGYGGTPGVMLAFAESFPSKGNYQTEHSGGTWVGGDDNQIVNDFTEIIHVMRSSGKAYVKWSLVLDEERGPNAGGCDTCTPLVTVDTATGDISYTIDFYTLGHFSKFVLPGAKRIYSANAVGIVSAAFLNPDGSKALVVFNDTTTVNPFQVQWGGLSFDYSLPGYAGATFVWSGPQSGSHMLNPTNRIMASSFNFSSGLVTEPTADMQGGYNLGYADDLDYAMYRNIDFNSSLTNVSARVASFGGGAIEFRLGSPQGLLLASVVMPDTGGWQTWQTVSAPVSSTNGVLDLYVVFTGGTSVGNLNWFQFEGEASTGLPGRATQLIWTVEPDLATNGLPFARQPILQTADLNGTSSTEGLPGTLLVDILQSAGAGPLLGTTNVNIGADGWNGVVPFSDIQINSVGPGNVLTARTASITNIPSDNLLLNGGFNSPNSGSPPEDWTPWVASGGGWANHENNAAISYDGSYYVVVGGYENQGGGCYQFVPASAGAAYELSVLSGADAWWLPYGELRLIFLDATGDEVGYSFRSTLDPVEYDNQYDIPHPWTAYTLTAVAPSETAQIKVEFTSTGTGSIWYENARLVELVSEPVLTAANTLPFTVYPEMPSMGQTNYIAGIADNGNGTYTLQFIGALGEEYYVQSTTNLHAPVDWRAMFGSTNAVTNSSGVWTHSIAGGAHQQFFRSVRLTP